MTAPLVIAMPGNEAIAQTLARILRAEIGRIELHAFPDGETYLRFVSDLAGRLVVIVCTLDRPNESSRQRTTTSPSSCVSWLR